MQQNQRGTGLPIRLPVALDSDPAAGFDLHQPGFGFREAGKTPRPEGPHGLKVRIP